VLLGKLICAAAPLTVLEGHRVACMEIPKGGALTSWGTAFGFANIDLHPGDYCCNLKVLKVLRARRSVTWELPPEPTFDDMLLPKTTLDEAKYTPGKPTPEPGVPLETFNGFRRPGNLGAGTRNYIVIMAVTSEASSYARALEELARKKWGAHPSPDYDGCSGIVAVAHTEGGAGTGDRGSSEGTGDEGLLGFSSHRDLLLRTLSGWTVHPNVGAMIIVDSGTVGGPIQFIKDADGSFLRIRSQGGWALSNDELKEHITEHNYPIETQRLEWMSLSGDFSADLAKGQRAIAEWMPELMAMKRVECPLRDLFLAQQCGGSDAFSGVSANPLLGKVSKHIVMHGGTAVLAETDELIGGEYYVVENTRDFETAQAFVDMVERFKDYAGRFGYSAEGNPSGGNNYRGLYNIVIKSLGAAKKRDPMVRLEHCVNYASPLYVPFVGKGTPEQPEFPGGRRGFCFMDSPGNDMESISGEVACGCNMVCFTTGNGSITNFPFVPTIKVLTTTGRYSILSNDIDVNAGQYLDGNIGLEELGEAVFQQMIRVASGELSVGEKCGHHQVQIWRDWPGKACCADDEETLKGAVITDDWRDERPDLERDGKALTVGKAGLRSALSARKWMALPITNDLGTVEYATDGIGLLLPTSLCSGQAGNMIAKRLHDRFVVKASSEAAVVAKPAAGEKAFRTTTTVTHVDGTKSTITTTGPVRGAATKQKPPPFSRIVAIPHTEGCGSSGGDSEDLANRTLIHHLLHPNVRYSVLLEHGCEKTHNDAFQNEITKAGRGTDQFDYLSLQLDGGVEKCYAASAGHFSSAFNRMPLQERTEVGLDKLSIGVISRDPVPEHVQKALATLVRAIIEAGGNVVCAGTVVAPGPFVVDLFEGGDAGPTDGRAVRDEETGELVAPKTLGYGQLPGESGLHIMQTSSSHFVEMLTGVVGTGVGLVLAYAARPVQSHPMIPTAQFGLARGSNSWSGEGIPDTALAAGVDVMLPKPAADAGTAEEDATATTLMDLVLSVASGEREPVAMTVGNTDFQLSRGFTGISL
jgi:altronate dehydratase